jgi:DNA-binding LacI/PurR family transcriptional regulator
VTIDRDLARPERTWWVGSDTHASTLRVLDHLAEAGARRIALLTLDAPWSWLADSAAAYDEWCAAQGAAPLTVSLPLGSGAEPAASQLLDTADAIFAPPEHFAPAVARAATRRGLRLGADLVLAAGVDSTEARTHHPAITALDLNPQRQGEQAVELLEALLAGGEPSAPRIVAAELRVRPSSVRPGG